MRILSILISLFFLSLAYAQSVITFRRGVYPEKERIVLDVSKKVDYRVLVLENPKRIVVDIMDTDVLVKNPKDINIRTGKHPWGTRIVIEKDFSYVKSLSLEEPFRIVLDVYKQRGVKEYAISIRDDDPLVAILDPKVLSILVDGKEAGKIVEDKSGHVLITQKRTIVIDPGHGGHDPGAIGFMGIKEKDVVLSISKKLADYLRKDGRFNVIMTRDRDVFVELHKRAEIALKNKSDLFVSIHANASPTGISSHARGTLIFAISSEAARRKRDHMVKSTEYSKLVLGTSDVPINARVVLADLAMDVTLYESVNFARIVSSNLSMDLSRDVSFKGIQKAGFAVLKTPGIPSVLVEVGFITNPEEAMLMNTEDFQDSFAKTLYKSIVNYFFPERGKKVALDSYR